MSLLPALLFQVWIWCPNCIVGMSPLPTAVASATPTAVPSSSPTAAPTGTPAATATGTPVPIGTPTASPIPPATFPVSDSAAAAAVAPTTWEPRPDNYPANKQVPSTSQLSQVDPLSGWYNTDGQRMIKSVTGNYGGVTDAILQWGAAKWGFPPDLVRAIAVVESSWHQYHLGDIGNGASLSILQIKSASWTGTCPGASSATSLKDPNIVSLTCLSNNYTAFAVDYKLAIMRACVVGDGMTWLATATPTAGKAKWQPGPGANNDLMGCAGAWYSGSWQDAGSLNYQAQVQQAENNKTWLSY